MEHAIALKEERFVFNSKARNISIGLALAGIILFAIGFMTSGLEHHLLVKKIWANLLLNSYYFMLFGAGATFIIAVKYIANAGWYTVVKRIPEAMSAYLPIGMLTLFAVVALGSHHLYHWAHEGITDVSSEHYDKVLAGKSPVLNMTFVLFSIVAFIGTWTLFARMLRKNSLDEDANGGLTFFNRSIKQSAAFVFIFAFTFSLISWVIIMSIDAHWYSTIFSVNNFAVSFVTSWSIIALIVIYLKSLGHMEYVTEEHLHDIGKFMFAFSIFWCYTWISQYLLIWYANIPEEGVYYAARVQPTFRPFFYINVIMNFAIPFLFLMFRGTKRNPKTLMIAALIILVGHWIDLYLMIMPGTMGKDASIGGIEIGTTLLFAGVFIFLVLTALTKASLYPVNHPYLDESRHHDTGV